MASTALFSKYRLPILARNLSFLLFSEMNPRYVRVWDVFFYRVWYNSLEYNHLGPVSRKSRKLFGPEKPFVKFGPAYSVHLVFSYVVKGIKIKTNAKFCASKRLRFEDKKRIMSPEMLPKSFGTFEKRAPGPSCSKHRPYSKMADTRNDLGLNTWKRGLVGQTSKAEKF